MGSYIRSMKRAMVREKCYKRDRNVKAFHSEWAKYCNEENKEVKNHSKTKATSNKKYNIDNSKAMMRRMKTLKSKLAAVKNPARLKKVESGN